MRVTSVPLERNAKFQRRETSLPPRSLRLFIALESPSQASNPFHPCSCGSRYGWLTHLLGYYVIPALYFTHPPPSPPGRMLDIVAARLICVQVWSWAQIFFGKGDSGRAKRLFNSKAVVRFCFRSSMTRNSRLVDVTSFRYICRLYKAGANADMDKEGAFTKKNIIAVGWLPFTFFQ